MLVMVHDTIFADYVEELAEGDLMRSGAQGMLASLGDPYASFFGPEDLRRFREGNSGVLVGIGVMLNPAGDILYPQPNGNAAEAGIRPGDRFLEIDGQDVAGFGLTRLAPLLRGEPGSLIHLKLSHPDGTEFQARIARSDVPTLTVGDVRMVDRELGIGHIHIRSFAKSTESELDRALTFLMSQGMKSLILDLRWNPGGQLPSAVGVAGRFLDGHLVCTLQSRHAPMDSRHADRQDKKFFGKPLVLLVNEGSASGSEVVAAALRERGFATLVGSRTYGKGIYQEVFEYEAGEFALQFTAGYYITPAGHILEDHLDPALAGCLEPDLAITPDPQEDVAIRIWQQRNPAPAIYREEVHALFPAIRNAMPPPDRTLDTAVNLLRAATSAP
jgi:carboxyl-terminal processing protease